MTEPEQEWADQPATVEGRLQRLERVMLAIHDQRTEGFRLAESVDRLGLNAGALQEALLQVDRNQQTLTQLGNQLQVVTKSAATKADLEANREQQVATTLDFRKQTLRKIYTTGLLLIIGLLVSAGVLVEYQSTRRQSAIHVCEARNAQNAVLVDILRQFGSEKAISGAARIEELIVDCEDEVK